MDTQKKHTSHCEARMQQRGITAPMIRIAIEHGDRVRSHACSRYVIGDRNLLGTPYAVEADRLRGLCVVVAEDNQVVTAMWDRRKTRPGLLRRSSLRQEGRR